jgi:hypothetical protein
VLLLSTEALEKYYQRRMIYFWSNDKTTLVPDLRYLSRTISRELQPTEIVNWLTGDPGPLLDGAVASLPKGAAQIGRVPAASDGRLRVNLNAAALSPEDPTGEALGKQLMWSLRPNLGQSLELRIDQQTVGTFGGAGYLASNSAYRASDLPERFCVYAGQVRRLTRSANPTLPVPVVTSEVNRNVFSAALAVSGQRTYAALVAKEGGEQVLRIGSAPNGKPGTFKQVALPGPVGQPVWAVDPDGAVSDSAVGLVPAGGTLFSFTADAVDPRPVEWPGGPGPVSVVAVAPDGHRVAVVAGGRLYLSVLTANGNGMQLSSPSQGSQEIRTLMRNLSAVDWSSEGALVVAGTLPATGRVAISEVSIDGTAQDERLADLGTNPVTHLAAFPVNPATAATADAASDALAYVAGKVAYSVFVSDRQRIAAGDLAGPPPGPPPSTSPTAPFFLN